MAAVAGCSSRPAPYERLGIGVSTEGEHCILALHGQRIGDLDDFQTKIRLRAALPHHPFSTGIQTVGTVPSACIQKIYEVLRAAHVQTVGILADPQNGAPVQP
jgi:hypothetical protein